MTGDGSAKSDERDGNRNHVDKYGDMLEFVKQSSTAYHSVLFETLYSIALHMAIQNSFADELADDDL